MTKNSDASASRIPKELINAIRSKECILLAGPGLSHYARNALGSSPPRRWKDTLVKLISVCKKNGSINWDQKKELDTLMSKASLPAAGSKLQEYLTAKDKAQSQLQKHLSEILLCNEARAGDVHLLLAQIPFCGYCTINYDTFIEDAYLRIYELHPATFDLTLIDNAKQEYLAARNSAQAEQKFILKLLGDVYHPTSLNLGDRYLKDWLNKNTDPQKAEALKDIFLDSPILLIGFEPDDPDLKGLFGNKTIFKSTPKPNQYTRLVEGTPQQCLEDKKITPIWYTPEAELESILKEILHSLGIQPVTEKRAKSDVGTQQSTPQIEKDVRSKANLENEPVHIFISWSRQDEIPKGQLVKHLRPLLDSRKISIWAGEELGIDSDLEITKHMNEARVFLPLISADFFESGPCQLELGMAIQRYKNEKANQRGNITIRIIPILIRSYSWEDTLIGRLKLPSLPPKDEIPVMESEHPDQVFSKIVKDIRGVVEELNQESDIQEKFS